MDLETFDRADLTALFPDLSADEIARMRAAAVGVEALRLPTDPRRWDWFPDHVQVDPPVGTELTVLGTTVQFGDTRGDQMELNLCVVREPHPRLTVQATLDIDCSCDRDHGMHALRREERLVGTALALSEAFESAAATLVRWAGGSLDSFAHRVAAGLPGPKPR